MNEDGSAHPHKKVRVPMSSSKSSNDLRLGFLCVVETESTGFVGGILVTNRLGRPLEFQCTTPVKPNRTQVILYGPTLRSFVSGELIGKTLCERLNAHPHLVLIDQPELLSLREFLSIPVGCLVAEVERRELPDETLLGVGRNHLWFHTEHPDDHAAAGQLCEQVPADADLKEPLERVREALQETLRSTAAA
jgi:hypothetical protein